MTVTYVDQIDSVLLTVQVSNGASPEVFSHPCLINLSRSISLTAQATATVIPRCDTPTAPGKTVRTVTSTDSTISGEGILTAATAKIYADWLMTGAPKNIKVQAGASTGHLVVTGSYILEEFTVTGSKLGDEVTATVKFSQADQPVMTAHA